MKVLYFMNHVDQGGAALALFDLIYELKERENFQCVVITGKKNKLNDMLDEIGVENYHADFKNFMSSYKRPQFLYKILLKLRYILGQKKSLSQIESVIDFNTIDIIHSNLNRIDIGVIFGKKYGIPHIWHIREHGELDFKLMSVKKDPISYMNSFESEYIVVSESVKNIWVNRGLNAERFHLIYDGVRTELYEHNNKNIEEEKIKMLFLGGYDIKKGQEELIDALGLLSAEYRHRIQADFYGNGSDKYIEYLKQKVSQYGLDDVVNLYPYDNKIWEKTPKYDVGLTCSNAEAFGRVTVEYMLSGLCPIVSNTGANQELVENGVSGIVYEKGNLSDLKNKIVYLIEHRDIISKCAQSARYRAINNFSMKKHADEVMKLYKAVTM